MRLGVCVFACLLVCLFACLFCLLALAAYVARWLWLLAFQCFAYSLYLLRLPCLLFLLVLSCYTAWFACSTALSLDCVLALARLIVRPINGMPICLAVCVLD
jgi:hypothetical protein